ncbi:hydrogenase, partial [Thermodesulfobacteriota bacterium]
HYLTETFFPPELTNPRMGLSAHLEGVLTGMFLVLLGLAWGELNLSQRIGSLLYYFFLFAAYATWGFTLLAAIFGTSRLQPIAGAGYEGAPWQEAVVGAGLVAGSIVFVLACLAAIYGLRGTAARDR